jgi:glycosyltransferase involved in cell wall biosynthesis
MGFVTCILAGVKGRHRRYAGWGLDFVKILLLVLNQVGRGTYWRAYHLARYLARRGQEVTLIATSCQNRTGTRVSQCQGFTLVESPDLFSGPLRSGWDPWNTLNRIRWLQSQPFDLVHAFESRPTVIYPALYLKSRRSIPLVLDWADWFGQGGSVEERPNPWVRAVLRPVETYYEEHFRPLADRSTVICSLLQEKARRLGISPQNILLLPNGSDTDRFAPMDIPTARRELNIDPDARVIGYVGTIFKRDAQLMADAFNLLTRRYDDLRLIIAGHCPFDLRPLAERPDRVLHTGFLEDKDLNIVLAASDLFWLPLSDSNANRGRFPLKFTDYLALGRPIVATRVGDVAGIMDEQRVGLTSPPNADAFAEQTMSLFEDQDLRRELGLAARRLAETRFNWDTITEKLLAFYGSLLDTHGGSLESH